MSEREKLPPIADVTGKKKVETVEVRLLKEVAITAVYLCPVCQREHGFAIGDKFYAALSELDGKRVLLRCPDSPGSPDSSDTLYGAFLSRKRLQAAAQTTLEETVQWSHELV